MTERPTEWAYLLVADYGPDGGGWGPMHLKTVFGEGVAVYTGENEEALAGFAMLAEGAVADGAVRAARLLKFERPIVVGSWPEIQQEGEAMQFGSVVAFNDGQHNQVAFVRGGTGDTTDLAVLTKDGVQFEENVPRRDPSDYGAEGGGRTWHPVGQ